jgi:hypothetical protein
VFYAFDLLSLDGEGLRPRPLKERKRLLRTIVQEQPSVMLYTEHIEGYGVEFFRPAGTRRRSSSEKFKGTRHGQLLFFVVPLGLVLTVNVIASIQGTDRALPPLVIALRQTMKPSSISRRSSHESTRVSE